MGEPPADAPPVLADPAVPVAPLLGPGAAAVVAAAVAPGEVLATRPVGATYHRGRSLTVRHEVTVRRPDGRRATEEVVLCGGRTAPEGALVVRAGGHDVVVWRGPDDPWLPGLAVALDPARLGPLLRDCGFPDADLRAHTRVHRPGRRAVVEVTGPGVRAFLKVVRPRAAETLHRRHVLLAGAVPVPVARGWSPEHGLVVLEARPGRTVRQALRTTGALPRPAAVLALLDALPDPAPVTSADRGAPWRLAEHAAHVGAVVPALADRAAALAAALAPAQAAAEATPAVPVHGDLHEAQLLLDGGRIAGLLDVDTFGLGRRVDDLATYLGHLAVLATTMPRARSRVDAHARRLLAGFDRTVDPALLRAAVAAVVLGLATGPFRVLEPGWRAHTGTRLALAEGWLTAGPDGVRSGGAAVPHSTVPP